MMGRENLFASKRNLDGLALAVVSVTNVVNCGYCAAKGIPFEGTGRRTSNYEPLVVESGWGRKPALSGVGRFATNATEKFIVYGAGYLFGSLS